MGNQRKYRIEVLHQDAPVDAVLAGGEAVQIPGSTVSGSVHEDQCPSCQGWFETRGIFGANGALARMARGCPFCGAPL